MSSLISRIYDWVTDKGNNVKITASRVDAEMNQVITALNRKVLCASSAPGSPIAGQTWFDTTNKVLKVYRNNEWVIQGIVHVGASAPATPQEGDLWYKTTDDVIYKYDGSSWASASFTPSYDNALAGSVLQVVNYQTGATASGSTTIPADGSTPQNSEGDEYMTLSITPKNASNKLKIEVVINALPGVGYNCAALFQDSAANALAWNQGSYSGDVYNKFQNMKFTYFMTAGTTSATTFKVRAGNSGGGSFVFNYNNAFGSLGYSSITITEIKV